jgi:hypothetical protein
MEEIGRKLLPHFGRPNTLTIRDRSLIKDQRGGGGGLRKIRGGCQNNLWLEGGGAFKVFSA